MHNNLVRNCLHHLTQHLPKSSVCRVTTSCRCLVSFFLTCEALLLFGWNTRGNTLLSACSQVLLTLMRSYNQKLSSKLPWAHQVFPRLVLAVLFFNLSILIHLFSQANRSLVTYDPLTDVQIAEIKSQIHKYLQGAIDEIEVNSVLSREGLGYCFHPVLSQGRINENVFWRAVFNPKSLFSYHFCFFWKPVMVLLG